MSVYYFSRVIGNKITSVSNKLLIKSGNRRRIDVSARWWTEQWAGGPPGVLLHKKSRGLVRWQSCVIVVFAIT